MQIKTSETGGYSETYKKTILRIKFKIPLIDFINLNFRNRRNGKPDLKSGFFWLMRVSIISAMSLKKLCSSTILSCARSCESMVVRLNMSYTFLRSQFSLAASQVTLHFRSPVFECRKTSSTILPMSISIM